MAQGHPLSSGDTHVVSSLSGTLCLAHQEAEAPQLPVTLGQILNLQTQNWDKLLFLTQDRSCTYLEDIGEVSEVENIVELDSCWQESGSHLPMQPQGQGNELLG